VAAATPIPQDVPGLLAAIRAETVGHPLWKDRLHRASRNEILLREHSRNTRLLLIIEGEVSLTKSRSGEEVFVDRLGPGALLGLISFTTGEPSMTSARSLDSGEFLVLEQHELETLASAHPRLKELFDPLIIRNLAERYRRLVGSNLEIHELAGELRHERNQLSSTLANLEATKAALIAKEKLAVLGQLVAGIAHELNNPAASLQHGLDVLRDKLANTIADAKSDWKNVFLKALEPQTGDARGQRHRMEELAAKYPEWPRHALRRLSLLPEELLCELESHPGFSPGSARELLDVFETGLALRGIGVAGERIVRLVSSLKSYSRDGSEAVEFAHVEEGIRDTLVLLKKPLRGIEVILELDHLPEVKCQPGTLNQVWTNLIVNAADAMQGKGTLRIRGSEENGWLTLRFEDSGPGVPADLRERIFAMNFTTKSGEAAFGLGLGLALSREIIQRHGGIIACEGAGTDLGGAVFVVRLPLTKN
jgi:signal transduction histidine kinase